MKKILFTLLSVFIISGLYAQNFVLDVKGNVLKNGSSIKKGEQLSDTQKLNFQTNSELRLLTPKGYAVISSNNPKSNTSELGGLIKEMVISVSQKNLNTRGFSEMTDAQIETDLSQILKLLNVNQSNFKDNLHQYIEPYTQSRYTPTENARVANILQNRLGFAIPRTLGAMKDEQSYKRVPQAVRLVSRSYTSLPTEYSLKQYCPIPKNQSFSDCVGWSTTYAARTMMYAIQNKITDRQLITAETFAPSFTYSQIKLNPADAVCDKGTYIESAMRLLKNQGAVKYNQFEYSCSPAINNQHVALAAKNKIKGYKRLTEGYYPDKTQMLSSIKKSLTENKPVVLAIEVYESFYLYTKNFYTKTEFWNGIKDKASGGHAITVVGYDDKKFGGAFELMNSWGTYWGNDGFLWVKYDDIADIAYEAYEMIENDPVVVTPEPKPVVVEKNDLSGNLRLVLADGSEMPVQLGNTATRDFNIVQVEKSTYSVTKPYNSGTQFRIHFANNQPAYVYLISYGTTTQKVGSIFPFEGYSAYLDYKQNEVAIPNEEYLIQMDNNVGTDYLCILYSKEELDIKAITQQMQSQAGGFNVKLKAVLKDKLVEGSNISFQANKINFDAKSKGKTVVPIVVEVKHID